MKSPRVLDLRPTQFAIGMTEVERKAKKLRRLSKKKLAKYVKQNPVAVVRAPDVTCTSSIAITRWWRTGSLA